MFNNYRMDAKMISIVSYSNSVINEKGVLNYHMDSF